MEIYCPQCGSTYIIDSANIPSASPIAHCPHCKSIFRIPASPSVENVSASVSQTESDTDVAANISMSKIVGSIDTSSIDPDYVRQSIGKDFSHRDEDETTILSCLIRIFQKAIECQAHNIHIVNGSMGIAVLFRMGGLLHIVDEIPLRYQLSMINNLKELAGLDNSIVDHPQSNGHFRFEYAQNQSILYGISTLPTLAGENFIIEDLTASHDDYDLDSIGLTDSDKNLIKDALCAGSGMILVCGSHKLPQNRLVVALGEYAGMRGRSVVLIDKNDHLAAPPNIPQFKFECI